MTVEIPVESERLGSRCTKEVSKRVERCKGVLKISHPGLEREDDVAFTLMELCK